MQGPTSNIYFSQRLRLHYVDWGNEGAPPMLLIHGGRDHCRNWDWVAEAFRDDYHIIAPDLRGHGDSQWLLGGSYDAVDYVYDIAQLLHQRHHTPVTIIGHSLGGSISLLYSGLYPETVTRLVSHRGHGAHRRKSSSSDSTSRCPGAWTPGSRISARFPAASRGATARWKTPTSACRRKTHT